jgi:hypothetical protein
MAEISLREHVDQRFMDFDRRLTEARTADRDRVQLALTSAKEAVDKAEQANERRLSLLNEFRSQQAEEARKYVPRETYDLALGQILARIAALETSSAANAGQGAGMSKFWGIIVSAVGVVGIIATIVISTLLRS